MGSCHILSISLCKILLENESVLKYGLLGLLLGFTYLIRPEAFVPGVLVIISLLCMAVFRLFKSRPIAVGQIVRELSGFALASAMFVLMTLPYLLFLYDNTGELTLAGKTADPLIYYGEMYEGTPEVELQLHREQDPGYFEQNVIEYIQFRGFDLLPRFKQNAIDIVAQMIGVMRHAGLVLLMTLVLYFLGRKRNQPRPFFVHDRYKIILASVLFLAAVPSFLLFHVSVRFMTPYSLLILLLIAGLVDYLLSGIDYPLVQKQPTVFLYALMTRSHIRVQNRYVLHQDRYTLLHSQSCESA